MTAEAAQLTRPRTLPLRLAAWCAGPPAIAAAHFLLIEAHPIVRMCALIGVLFFWMKAVVLAEYHAAGRELPPPWRLLAWTVLWPGMRLQRVSRRQACVDSHEFGARGVANIVCGFLLIGFGLWIASWNWWLVFGWWFLLVGIPSILAGMSLILHYGVFNILTAGWRAAGFNVGPLFRNPFASRSLSDFWTRRWNLAYAEMCQETVLRAIKGAKPKPAMPMAGCSTADTQGSEGDSGLIPGLASRALVSRANLATGTIFLFSGLLHEVAISLPVQAGYGLPTLYFALNGGAMLVGRKFKEGGIAARAWAAFWVIAPLPLLFHPWFLAGIVLPMVGVRT